MTITKRIMIVNNRPPHGTLHAWESLDLALTAAAFEQEVTIVFINDGVYQLLAGQDTEEIDIKNFSPAFRTFRDHGIDQVFVEVEALSSRGLCTDDLLIGVELVDTQTIRRLMSEQDIILHF